MFAAAAAAVPVNKCKNVEGADFIRVFFDFQRSASGLWVRKVFIFSFFLFFYFHAEHFTPGLTSTLSPTVTWEENKKEMTANLFFSLSVCSLTKLNESSRRKRRDCESSDHLRGFCAMQHCCSLITRSALDPLRRFRRPVVLLSSAFCLSKVIPEIAPPRFLVFGNDRYCTD